MKNLLNLKRVIFLLMMVSGPALLNSCATYRPYSFAPVTIPDIIQMSKDKVPAQNIINDINKSHTAYTIKANEYAKLQKAGVSDSVVNYMQQTQLEMTRYNQQWQDSNYWTPGYGNYWYGTPYYYYAPYVNWGWSWSPTFNFRGGSSYHGGFHGGARAHVGGYLR